ncbi:hypothetical protein ACH5RR_021183 [Cinchona calisaya]|uniref:MBD domain-containing protein n=1 Tax=Cinchona calisaya TaxID=153742 RepID=A0ABD2ZGK9_9GENT
MGEPEQFPGDQLSPDPLLQTGWFIDAGQKAGDGVAGNGAQANRESEPENRAAAETNTETSTAPETTGALDITPVSQRRPKRPVEEMTDQPDWLPEGWKTEVRVRTSGATAGVADRYFIAPSGQKFRSKVEVLHFLETGSRRKKKLKSDADVMPSDSPSDQRKKISKQPSAGPSDLRKKKPKSNIRNFSDVKFDFRIPPQSLTWVQVDDSPDEWAPISVNATVPESEKTEWGNVFSRVTQLDRSNGAS